jgi:hypothetical protein
VVDEKCRYVSTAKGVGLFDSQPNVEAPKVLSTDPDCLIRDPLPVDTVTPKERATMLAAEKPWEASGDLTWRHAQPTKSWKFATINKFPTHMPDK